MHKKCLNCGIEIEVRTSEKRCRSCASLHKVQARRDWQRQAYRVERDRALLMLKTCPDCGKDKPLKEFGRYRCRSCQVIRSKMKSREIAARRRAKEAMRLKAIPVQKTCSGCQLTLLASEFYGIPSNKDGLAYHCKRCTRARTDAWRHTENGRRASAKYRAENRELCNQRIADWAARNVERRRVANALLRLKTKEKSRKAHRAWQIANRDKECMKQAKRRAIKLRACPSWADLDAIAAIYAQAQRLSRETGIKHHVDHIYPLQSKVMCGLHVAENLQVLPDVINWKKHNHVVEIEEELRCCAWPSILGFDHRLENHHG